MQKYCRICGTSVESEGHTHPEKMCEACHIVKKLEEFPEHPSSLDGHRHTCIECTQHNKAASLTSRIERQKQQRIEYAERLVKQKERNTLLAIYGYKWKKELVEVKNCFDDFDDVEEKWILHAPTSEAIDLEDAMLEIYALQQHKPGHPSTLWAKEILSRPNVLVLDTETTGFDETSEIIEIAIVDINGRKRLNTLIQCQAENIPLGAYNVHHIHKKMLQKAYTFPQIWQPKLIQFLLTHEIVIYNAEYDIRLLRQTAARYQLEVPELRTHCLMHHYSFYVGEPSPHKEGYRFQSLERACSHFDIKQTSAHRALDDAHTSLRILQCLAAQAITP